MQASCCDCYSYCTEDDLIQSNRGWSIAQDLMLLFPLRWWYPFSSGLLTFRGLEIALQSSLCCQGRCLWDSHSSELVAGRAFQLTSISIPMGPKMSSMWSCGLRQGLTQCMGREERHAHKFRICPKLVAHRSSLRTSHWGRQTDLSTWH